MADKTILVVGTYDTKDDELTYMADRIRSQGGGVLTMDVSVLGDPSEPTDYSKHDVAEAGGSSIKVAIASGDENTAMQIMARGSAMLTARLWAEGAFDGVVVLGGSMGTDLALDLCSALPLGVPKYIVSTVAFSTLIPAERLPADIQMILWAGGLYGLNSVCKSSLSQAAGAVLGAARAVEAPDGTKPLIGMTSLGKSALKYMVYLKPELEKRGYEVAVFHATGMGGRAFESLASQGAFAAVFDFCTQELGNHTHGSDVTAGADRLTNAGRAGIAQLVSTGCYDLVDLAGWRGLPEKWMHHPNHAHNRLITSVVLNADEVRTVARAHGRALAEAKGETVLLLPLGGCGEWDRPGAELHNPAGLAAFCAEMRASCPANARLEELDLNINDEGFAARALEIFDDWCERGIVAAG
ncbi:Tm-1-like ATP-binding domain-containing protein [Nioella nitratireducens]|uniref:Tm-1-like ATP-binding domain-containing protein n=1 Tax=Nioella nitratireducens TaxID=1287720 RepID=UPI0008FD5071|nr:Tm-1-like ATP-binding domain-containing protein [Nioella nitratireducens]